MTRLTRTIAKGTPFEEVFKPEWIDDIKAEENRIEAIQSLSKLKMLEDLEEELGCPLDVVVKLLLNQEIYTNWGKRVVDNIQPYFENEKRHLMIYLKNGMYHKLKDYGKTWWLDKPESVKEQ